MEENGGGVFSNRKKPNPTVQKSLDVKEAKEDRLSSLPDVLILHILSFLKIKEVIKTCALSKRWQFMWTMISELDFMEDDEYTPLTEEFVERVWRMLAMCSGFHLKRFAVNFRYLKRCASTVNSWINLLVKNKVENITLRCCGVGKYILPQMLYLNSSMTSLDISSWEIDPRGIIDWGSLKRLEIHYVKLTNCVMEKILSGCPVLEVLNLDEVSGLTCLNIGSPNLTTLKLQDCRYSNGGFHVLKPFLEISAPHLRVLLIKVDVRGLQFRLRNILSLVRANIYINGDDWETSMSTMSYMKELLLSLHSVMDLQLGRWCIEILSSMELQRLKVPPSTRSCLTLYTFCHEGILPGILTILKSSPYLKTLVIKSGYSDVDLVPTYLHVHTLELVMSHLKTIEITGFTIEFLRSKTMLMLVELLLKSSNVLEKMVIRKEMAESSSSGDSTCFSEFSSKLLTFPRASPKAIVMVC